MPLATLPAPPDFLNQPDLVETTCPLCEAHLKSYSGRINHMRITHGVPPPLTTRLRSPKCLCCLGHFGAKKNLLVHLRRNLHCALHLMTYEPGPEEEEEEMEDDVPLTHRTTAPRRGQKPR
eukprot:5082836-Amphidinium_carterae.1